MKVSEGTFSISVNTYTTDTSVDVYIRLLTEVVRLIKDSSKEIQ